MAKRVRVEGILLGGPDHQNTVQRVCFRSGRTTRIIDVTRQDVSPWKAVHDWSWACKQMLKGKTVQGPYDESTYSIRDGHIQDKNGCCNITEEDLEYPAWVLAKGKDAVETTKDDSYYLD